MSYKIRSYKKTYKPMPWAQILPLDSLDMPAFVWDTI